MPLEGIDPRRFQISVGAETVKLDAIEPVANSPVMLESYGAFRQKLLPYYDAVRLEWLRRGGSVEIVQLETPPLGQDLAVTGLIEATEHLGGRAVVYRGRSSGATLGLIVALRYPDLFRAVWAEAGLTDLVGYPTRVPGKLWLSEYGDPQDPVQLERLKRLSPLNLLSRDKKVPTILLTTSSEDPVVDPRHSWRFLERAQELGLADKVYLQQQELGIHGALGSRLVDQVAAVDFLWSRAIDSGENR